MDYTSFIFSNPPEEVDTTIFVDADCPERSISWRQYVTGVKRAAVGLQAMQVLEQDCVALLSRNDIYISVLGDAVTAAGAVFSGLPAEAKESELTHCCTTAQVKWLFVMPQLVGLAQAVAKNSGVPDENVLIFDPPGLEKLCPVEPHRRHFSRLLLDHDECSYSNPNPSKDLSKHVVSRLFTSGTTGFSKAADVSHKATIHRIRTKAFGHSDRSVRYLHFIAMHHMSGTLTRQQAVAGQCCMHVTNAQDASQIVSLIRQFKVESAMLTPRSLVAITGVVEANMEIRGNLESLRYVTTGGTQVPIEFLDNFGKMLSPEATLRNAYGSTEMGFVGAYTWHLPRDAHSTGCAMTTGSFSSVKILEPDSQRACAPGIDGEICAHNDQLFNAYHGNREATDSCFVVDELGRRWFRSGDKGSLTSDRELCITGRYKEVFKVGYEEVSAAEVASILLKHEGVAEAAVTAREDRHDSRYNEAQAFVVLNGNKRPEAQELVDWVAATLSLHKAPTGGVTIVESLPKNAMHKVVLRELLAVKPLPGSRGYMIVSGGQ